MERKKTSKTTQKKTSVKKTTEKEKTDLQTLKKRRKTSSDLSAPKRRTKKKTPSVELEKENIDTSQIVVSDATSTLKESEIITEQKITVTPEEELKTQTSSIIKPEINETKVSIDTTKIEEKIIEKSCLKKEEKREEIKEEKEREIEIDFPIILKDLAVKIQEKPSALIKLFMESGKMVTINHSLYEEDVKFLAEKLKIRFNKAPTLEERVLAVHEKEDLPSELIKRPPVVTLMGHVDHGKTSLLDAIRKSKVAESEYGGITQHIGAYQVKLPQGIITFLDTPGHEAFTAMRARGAKITDIVVLVVAADEGIMPQTIEAIDHAKEAGVSIIVAINKIDKPQADLDKVKGELQKLGLVPEEWGGKTITVPVSAKTGQGIDDLLEMILLEAEMLELKANPNRPAQGVIIEAMMTKEKGPVCTLLVQKGTLKVNDYIVAGECLGKIRAMFNEHGQNLLSAGPSTPVRALGMNDIPQPGEKFYVVEDEKIARQIIERRKEERKQIVPQRRVSLENIYSQIQKGTIKELKLIIKADVQGSLEAIRGIIDKFEISEIKITIIHQAVGNINPSDVILAVASEALVIGFNVEIDEKAKIMAQQEEVEIRIYNVIYELANEIKQALEGLLTPKTKKIFLGRLQVKKVFKLSKGTVVGCLVLKGKAVRSAQINILRNGEVIFEGKLTSLKRFKDDVREVQEGFECGVSIDNFNDWREDDIIEVYEIEKISRKL